MTAAGTWVVTISTAVTRRFAVIYLAESGDELVGRAVSGVEQVEVTLLDVRYDGEELTWFHPLDGVGPGDLAADVAFTARVKGNVLTGRSQSHIDATVIGTRRPPGAA